MRSSRPAKVFNERSAHGTHGIHGKESASTHATAVGSSPSSPNFRPGNVRVFSVYSVCSVGKSGLSIHGNDFALFIFLGMRRPRRVSLEPPGGRPSSKPYYFVVVRGPIPHSRRPTSSAKAVSARFAAAVSSTLAIASLLNGGSLRSRNRGGRLRRDLRRDRSNGGRRRCAILHGQGGNNRRR